MTVQSSQVVAERWYESAGTRLFAAEQGQGEPVIFLHGGLSDHQGALFRAGELARSYCLIAPDMRAAGRSVYAGPLSWRLLADDVLALMEQRKLTRAVIGGTSAGSAVALKFALSYPERTRALLLVAPVYMGGESGLTAAQRTAFTNMNVRGEQTLRDGISALFPLFETLPSAIREVALAMVGRFDPASVAATTRFLASGAAPFEHITELMRLTMPALVVPGTDPEHPVEVARAYVQTMPQAELAQPAAPLAPLLEALLRRS